MPMRKERGFFKKSLRVFIWSIVLSVAFCLGILFIVSVLLSGKNGEKLKVKIVELPYQASGPSSPSPALKLMSLNIAHGRNKKANQPFATHLRTIKNLDKIIEVIKRENPIILALAEVDSKSFWSGNMNQAEYIAEKAMFKYIVTGDHVKGFNLAYGSALLSRLPFSNAFSYSFRPSPPTFPKGFVVAETHWPGKKDLKMDIVSVHLDFSRRYIREQQLDSMMKELKARKKPLIIMGDFNSGWLSSDKSVIHSLEKKYNMKLYKPESKEFVTFPLTGRRLDWIIISGEFDFVSYKVLPDVLSDHFAVVAVIKLRTIPKKSKF